MGGLSQTIAKGLKPRHLKKMTSLVVVSGTNRPGSKTKTLSLYIKKRLEELVGPSATKISLLDLVELPLEAFAPSSFAEKPASVKPFIDQVTAADALLVVIPEYNGSAPGALKYFIDLLPFPKSLKDVPSAFVGVAAGRFGALRAVEHIQQVFEYRKAHVYSDRVFIAFADKTLNAEGQPTEEMTKNLLEEQIKGFLQFAKRLKTSGAIQ